jgi:hypothetical protein
VEKQQRGKEKERGNGRKGGEGIFVEILRFAPDDTRDWSAPPPPRRPAEGGAYNGEKNSEKSQKPHP